jgi:hypothetical protein
MNNTQVTDEIIEEIIRLASELNEHEDTCAQNSGPELPAPYLQPRMESLREQILAAASRLAREVAGWSK